MKNKGEKNVAKNLDFLTKWLDGMCPVDNISLKNGYYNVGWSMFARNVCSKKCYEVVKAEVINPQWYHINFYVNKDGVMT